MNIAEIKRALLLRVEDVVYHLFPNGKRTGGYYEVGGLSGDHGKSLRICLTGAKAGVWSDFATEEAGDILDLWVAARGHRSLREARKDMLGYLGVPEHQPPLKSKKTYKKASREEIGTIGPRVSDRLSERKISKGTYTAFGVAQKGDAVTYPYTSQDGELLWVKSISLDLDESGKKRVWTTPDPQPVLFGMHAPLVRAAGREIVITEGEVDAMSYYESGVPAVSVPFGAENHDAWVEHCFDWLQSFETVYLSFDNDDPGRAGVDMLIDRLGRDRCRVVELPVKDANEALVGGYDLKSYLEVAKTRDPEDMLRATSMDKKVWDVLRGGPRDSRGRCPFGWDPREFQFKFRQGEGTILTGYAGHGKSNFLYQLSAWWASKGEKVFIGSYEEPADQILSVMCSQAAGHRVNNYREYQAVSEGVLSNVFIHDCEDNVKHEAFFRYAEYAVKRYGCSLVVLDSLTTTDVDLDDKDSIAKFSQRSRVFWRTTGCHLVVVAHPRKGFDEKAPPLKQDIKGGGHLGDLFFNVLTVHRPEPSQFGASCADAMVVCSKQKVGGKKFSINLNYEPDSSRLYMDNGDRANPYYKKGETEPW